MSAEPICDATYERPVKATLHVHLDNGDSWPATEADLERFRLTDTLDAYIRFDRALDRALRVGGVLSGDLTNAELNPVRYLAEIAIGHPDLLDHPEHEEEWRAVAELERRLQQSGGTS